MSVYGVLTLQFWDDYLVPPIEATTDEDEHNGLPVVDTWQMPYNHEEQMPLLARRFFESVGQR